MQNSNYLRSLSRIHLAVAFALSQDHGSGLLVKLVDLISRLFDFARTSFRHCHAPPRHVTISDNTRWYSAKWRTGLGLWIGNGRLVMRGLCARLCCLSCLGSVCLVLVLVFGSLEFFLVPLHVFVSVLHVLFHAVVRLVSDVRPSVFRAWSSFGRRLYIRPLCT
jgi:hypothetical protein